MLALRPKLRGLHRQNDPLHYELPVLGEIESANWIAKSHRIAAPIFHQLPDGRRVAQWARTVRTQVNGFNPAGDCNGYFMSSKFQTNNNCYNYACNIASNSFAQPGRWHCKSVFAQDGRLTADSVVGAAKADGLLFLADAKIKLPQVLKSVRENGYHGHLVALLISVADSSIRWKGDYHWVRCDLASGRKWSQKDGPDQVTNYDFSGKRITDPSQADWQVNLGPSPRTRITAKYIIYTFAAWMYVPFAGVHII